MRRLMQTIMALPSSAAMRASKCVTRSSATSASRFTATFFQKHTLINVLLTYSVFDVSDTLLVMRP